MVRRIDHQSTATVATTTATTTANTAAAAAAVRQVRRELFPGTLEGRSVGAARLREEVEVLREAAAVHDHCFVPAAAAAAATAAAATIAVYGTTKGLWRLRRKR